MQSSAIAMSWLWFWRGLRRELVLPLVTLALAAAVAGGVALFSSQLERTTTRAANAVLGAGLVLRAHDPLPAELEKLAEGFDLATTHEVSFPTVAVAGERLKLTGVRAIAAPYPLRGEMILRNSNAPPHAAEGVPPAGAVWAAPGLAAALDIALGDSLTVGSKRFRLDAFVMRAPGARFDLANIAPLLIMNTNDLAATGLTGQQSRVSYKLLLAGNANALQRFRDAAASLVPAGAQWRDANDASRSTGSLLTNTQQFLRLAALATLLIAAAALIQSARHYLRREREQVAILKTLGAGHRRIHALYALELLWLTLTASAIGIVGAWGIARGLSALAATWFGLNLLPAPWSALAVGPVSAALLAAGLWLVPILTLAKARPAAVLRGARADRQSLALSLAAAALALIALILWQGGEHPTLGLWTLAFTLALIGLLAAVAYVALKLLGTPPASVRPAWRYGIGGLARRPARSLAEVVAFGLALTVILTLTGVRHDLLASWQATLPPNAPDHFIINIQSGQSEAVRKFLDAQGADEATLYPMVRARLTAINGTPAEDWKLPPGGDRDRGLLEREQTLSMSAKPGAGNRVVAGDWWTPGDAGKPWVSAGSDWAREIGVGLGDRLGFTVGGRNFTLTIKSLRDIHWQSMHPNFFLVMPPGNLQGLPATWITAVRLGDNSNAALELVKRFPNLTVIDVGRIIAQVKDLLRHAALALAAVFIFALLAALLVLLAALAASRAERRHELALLRVLGARRRLLGSALAAEFAALGALSGIAAGLVAAGAGYALARWVFEIPAWFDGWLVLAGTLIGIFLLGGAGLAATLGLTRTPPSAALRQGDNA